MTGVAAEITMEGLAEVDRRLRGLDAWDRRETLFALGKLAASGAKERIATEKAGPDGAAWLPWSDRYDETRERRHSLLVEENALLESLQVYASPEGVAVGTNLVYAATHQFGREEANIPARPFLGLSEEDRRDIRDLVLGAVEEAGQ